MKVALLLSGLPRKVEEGYNRTWKALIEAYDVDIYLQYWKDEDWQKVQEIYPNAKSYHMQEPFKFTHFKEGIYLPHTDTSRPLPQYDVMSDFRQFPMFYSWQKVYQDIYDTNIQYDFVIRSRYDIEISNPIKLENLNPNILNNAPGGGFFDDNLSITSKDNADKIFYNIFDTLLDISRNSGELKSAEQSWSMLITKSGLQTLVIPQLRFKLLRDDLVWWGDNDGNIISDRKPTRLGMNDKPK